MTSGSRGDEGSRPGWVERIRRLGGGEEEASAVRSAFRKEERLVYVLDAARWGRARSTGPAVSIRVHRRRRRGDGSWGKANVVPASEIRGSFHGGSPEDAELCALLRGGQPSGSSEEGRSEFLLDRHLAGVVIDRLLATGRLHLRDPDSDPLTPGRRVSWRPCLASRELDEDRVEVRSILRRGDDELPWSSLPLISPSGHFVHAGTVERWTGTEHFAWFDDFGGEPLRVPSAALPDFAEEIGALSDPPPVDLPGLRLAEEAPRPCLHVGHVDEGRRDVDVRIGFFYGDEELGLGGGCTLPSDPGILRDRGWEAQALAQLVALGMRKGGGLDERADGRLPAERLAEVIEELEELGWAVEVSEGRLSVASDFRIGVKTGEDWFDLGGGLRFGDDYVPLPRVLQAAREQKAMLPLGDGRVGLLPAALRRRLLDLELMGEESDEGLRIPRSRAWALEMLPEDAALVGDPPWVAWRAHLDEARRSPLRQEPEGFEGQLRPYQREGLGWLALLRELGLGGLLADDMGLGKTVQVLAFLQHLANGNDGARFLVVVPRSLLFNWSSEAERFCPGLSLHRHEGPKRARDRASLERAGICLTTYGVLLRDAELLADVPFDAAVLDEAQAIKNERSKTALAARSLNATTRLLISGTPVENRLQELWSLFEFLNPGMLGRSSTFARLVGERGDKALDAEGVTLLQRALRPFILRRTKEKVAPELPERTEQVVWCELEKKQRQEYERVREHYRDVLLGGGGGSGLSVLEALLRLRQLACHPGLLDPELTDAPSAKLELLIPQLEEIRAQGHKALVFSQFTSFLDLVEGGLREKELPFLRLDGTTRRREERVRLFQEDPELGIFLISLKAGGVGLNLTAAQYVFLLDPWWNPQSENQAIDRAHRIGQQQRVTAYRLVARGTIEEKILKLQDEKRELADAVLSGSGGLRSLSADDLDLLLG